MTSWLVPATSGVAPLQAKVNQVLRFKGLERTVVDEAAAGDIVAINGIEELGIGCTVCDTDAAQALPMLTVDEPTLNMVFGVNSSPLAGRSGKYLTTRHIRDRLLKELEKNVALRKPAEQLKSLLSGGKPAARKVFRDIKATETKFNGRGTEELVILRAG